MTPLGLLATAESGLLEFALVSTEMIFIVI